MSKNYIEFCGANVRSDVAMVYLEEQNFISWLAMSLSSNW
jgi:hypothetical protein